MLSPDATKRIQPLWTSLLRNHDNDFCKPGSAISLDDSSVCSAANPLISLLDPKRWAQTLGAWCYTTDELIWWVVVSRGSRLWHAIVYVDGVSSRVIIVSNKSPMWFWQCCLHWCVITDLSMKFNHFDFLFVCQLYKIVGAQLNNVLLLNDFTLDCWSHKQVIDLTFWLSSDNIRYPPYMLALTVTVVVVHFNNNNVLGQNLELKP